MHITFHSVPRFLDIIDRKCCVLSGPPCISPLIDIKGVDVIFDKKTNIMNRLSFGPVTGVACTITWNQCLIFAITTIISIGTLNRLRHSRHPWPVPRDCLFNKIHDTRWLTQLIRLIWSIEVCKHFHLIYDRIFYCYM